MVPPTRRSVLAGAVSLLAGCNDTRTNSNPPTERPRPENLATDPPVYALRNDVDEPLVRDSRETEAAEEVDETRHSPLILDGSDAAEAVEFVADVDGVEGARQFISETDFEAESVIVFRDSVGECYTQEFCYVAWTETEIDAAFGRHYRDPDVSCSTDNREAVATFVRIPDTLDADRIRSFGRSSGGDCRLPSEWRENPTGTAAESEGDE